MNLNGHEAENGGYCQGEPKATAPVLYSTHMHMTPHMTYIHYCQPYLLYLLCTKPLVKYIKTLFRPTLPSKPNRPSTLQTASCKKDCPQAIPIPPVSLSRTSNIILAPPPLPDKSVHPHKINLVPYAPSCRNDSNESSRNTRISFFLCPLKSNNPCLRVFKYPLNFCSRTKSGEPIFVQQSSLFFPFNYHTDIFAHIKLLFPLILCYVIVNSWFVFTHSLTRRAIISSLVEVSPFFFHD